MLACLSLFTLLPFLPLLTAAPQPIPSPPSYQLTTTQLISRASIQAQGLSQLQSRSIPMPRSATPEFSLNVRENSEEATVPGLSTFRTGLGSVREKEKVIRKRGEGKRGQLRLVRKRAATQACLQVTTPTATATSVTTGTVITGAVTGLTTVTSPTQATVTSSSSINVDITSSLTSTSTETTSPTSSITSSSTTTLPSDLTTSTTTTSFSLSSPSSLSDSSSIVSSTTTSSSTSSLSTTSSSSASSSSLSSTSTSSTPSVTTTSTPSSSTTSLTTTSTTTMTSTSTSFSSSSTTLSLTTASSTTTSATTSASSITADPDGVGPYSGYGTWFYTGLSACGTQDTDDMPIVAVSKLLFDNWPGYNGLNPNDNPICGHHLDITYGGKTLTVEVTDRCESCGERSLDLSPAAFEYFAPLSVGLFADGYTSNITWSWTTGTGRLPTLPLS